MDDDKKRAPRITFVMIMMCMEAVSTGATFGFLSQVLYYSLLGIGPGLWLGGVSGLLCGVVWCLMMTRLADRAGRWIQRPMVLATLVGAAVGGVSASVVHVGLTILLGSPQLPLELTYVLSPALAAVLFIGLPAGAMLGVLGGWLWRRGLQAEGGASVRETGP